MTTAAFAADRAWRRLLQLRDRLRSALRRSAAAVRPWLRREAWTAERLQELAAEARRRPRLTFAIVGLGALAVWAVGGRLASTFPGGIPTAEVREGPFSVDIVESGTMQALRSVTYASTIQSNQAKIVALAPEGKLVKKGDLLILFDTAPFEEEIRRNQALLAQALADLAKAKQDVKLQRIQNQEDLATARQKVERSRLELKDVQQGKGKLKEEEAASAVSHAQIELEKARSNAEDLRPLLAEGFITKIELERAEQQVQKAEDDLALAKRRRDALLEYGRPLELSQAAADASLTQESYRQLESATRYRVGQKQAAVDSAQSRIDEARSKLALAKRQLSRTEVRADVPGIVVYKDVFFGSEQRKPQVGDQVWANQPLLILPDISKMVVEIQVRETDIHKVAENQHVAIHVEAYPDLKLTGKVKLIGTLAREERDRRGSKFFGVTIEVNESDPRLRPGMTARAEILVDRRPSALTVPLEAVFDRDGRSIVYLLDGRSFEPRTVALGPSNRDFVVVEKGLAKGDRVALRDPTLPPPDANGLPSS